MPFASDPNQMFGNLPPDIAGQMQSLQMRQRIAQAMLQSGMTPAEAPQTKGRFQAPVSPLAGLANIAQAFAGAKAMNDSAQAYTDLGNKYQSGVADAMSKYQETRNGTPEAAPAPGAEGPTRPAIPGNPRQAVTDAMTSMYAPVRQIGKLDYAQMVKDPMKVDAGDHIELRKEGQVVGTIPKSASPDAALGASTTTRGQDMTQATTQRGQDMTQTTTERGQDLTDTRDRQLYGLATAGGAAGDGKIGQLSPIMETQAQAIAMGKQAPITARSGRPSPIMARVMELNPDYDAKDYGTHVAGEKFFTSGKGGTTIKSFNVGISHLNTLDGLVDAMANGDAPALNKIGNIYKTQTGQTAPNNFETARKVVGDEIVKAIVGAGGGVADREEAARTINAAGSPAQLKESIGVYKDLMNGQLGGLRQQYETATGKKDFDQRFLSADANAVANPAPAAASSSPDVDALVKKYTTP